MNERSIGNIKPEKWNNIPVCMVEAMRVVINESVRLEETNKELHSALEEAKTRSDTKIKKLQQETKKSTEDTLNQLQKMSKNTDTYIIQLKDTMKRDKETITTSLDDKYAELKAAVMKLDETVGAQDDSKKIMSVCKNWIRDSENRLEHKIGNLEGNFGEQLLKNILVRKVIGYSCVFSNYIEFFTQIQESILDLKKNEASQQEEIQKIMARMGEMQDKITSQEHSLTNKISDVEEQLRDTKFSLNEIDKKHSKNQTNISSDLEQVNMDLRDTIKESVKLQQQVDNIKSEADEALKTQGEEEKDKDKPQVDADALVKKIENGVKKDVQNLEARLIRLEETLNDHAAQNRVINEKMTKLESNIDLNKVNENNDEQDVDQEIAKLERESLKNKIKTESAKSDRSQLYHSIMDTKENKTQKTQEQKGNPNLNLNVDLEDQKNDIKLEVSSELNQQLDGIKDWIKDEMEDRMKAFNIIKRNTVDEVLKEAEHNKQPLSEDVERAIGRIIGRKLERSLSAPSRMAVKAMANLQPDSEVRNQQGLTAMASDVEKPIHRNFSRLLKDDNPQLVNDQVKLATKSSKNLKVTGVVPSLSKDITKASIANSQHQQMSSQQFVHELASTINEAEMENGQEESRVEFVQSRQSVHALANDVIAGEEGEMANPVNHLELFQNLLSDDHNNYYNQTAWYSQQLQSTEKFNRPQVHNISTTKVNVSMDNNIADQPEVFKFIHEAGTSGREYLNHNLEAQAMVSQSARKLIQSLDHDQLKQLEGKSWRTVLHHAQKKQKMQRQLVQLVNEPQNLRNILKLDEFNLSVWDVNYSDPNSHTPMDTFKKKAEINFDVNYFFKPDHKDEIEEGEGPKKLIDQGEKNYHHVQVKK